MEFLRSLPWRTRLVIFCVVIGLFLAALWPLRQLHGMAAMIGTPVWFFTFVAVAYVGSAALATETLRSAQQRYRRRLLMAMSTYGVVLIGSMSWLRGHREVSGPLLWLLAAAPAAPIVWIIAVMGLYLREESDELERAIQIEATLWATGAVLAVSTTWSFLANVGAAAPPPLFLVFPLFCVAMGLAQPFVRWRYR